MLAPYACDPYKSQGRLYDDKPTNYRNEFERDRDRIIHTNAFRRLECKTQVFINRAGDHYRTRLTHSLEVSTVARSIANTLNLSSDLAEAIALAHDLGHTPFGHLGEDALNECMHKYGGFSHNAHSLKILTKLEKRYAAYDGINLTWEVLEGIAKHNGPMVNATSGYIVEYNKIYDLKLHTYASAEAQVAALADDITYIAHDLEDSIGAKIIDFDDLAQIKYINDHILNIKSKFANINSSCLIYEVVRRIINEFVTDLLTQTNYNLKKENINTTDDIRNLPYQLVDFTEHAKKRIKEIKQFLFSKVYKNDKITNGVPYKKILKELFEAHMENLDLLPIDWRELVKTNDKHSQAEIVADYIAGMTDRFALEMHFKSGIIADYTAGWLSKPISGISN